MTKTRIKKRIIREKHKRLKLLNKNKQIFEKAKKLGFKSAQEFILYNGGFRITFSLVVHSLPQLNL